jgi:tripartite-type tricarboxylate transporter receptor subunit TctC
MERFTARLGAVALLILPALPVFAQTFPSKPVTILVGFAPGNVIDTPLRMMLPYLQKALGQPVVLDYKPGAGGNIAYTAVARSVPADGYTLVASTSGVVTVPLFNKVNFDPIADLPPIGILSRFRALLSSPAAAPWNDFKGMIAYAKANPGKLNIGYSSAGGAAPLIGAAIQQFYGVSIESVLYRGTPELTTAIFGGEVQLAFLGDTAAEQMKAGKLKVISLTGTSRIKAIPDVPTLEEVGIGMSPVPDLWMGIHTRAGTPRPVIDTLYKAFTGALNDPATREQLLKANVEIVDMGPDQAAKLMADTLAASRVVAEKAGIKPQD